MRSLISKNKYKMLNNNRLVMSSEEEEDKIRVTSFFMGEGNCMCYEICEDIRVIGVEKYA